MNVLCACGCGGTPPLWKRNEFTRGRVKGQPMKCIPGHRIHSEVSPADLFWRRVSGGDVVTCWLWDGYVMPNGYGQFNTGRKTVLAHRWAYESMRHQIPQGLDLDHLCETRRCVNPWHLEPVTRSVNLSRQRRNSGRTINTRSTP